LKHLKLTLNLNSPIGGSAKGIPLKEKKSLLKNDFSIVPSIWPVVVLTIGPKAPKTFVTKIVKETIKKCFMAVWQIKVMKFVCHKLILVVYFKMMIMYLKSNKHQLATSVTVIFDSSQSEVCGCGIDEISHIP
jgi:hypothetical protein